MDEAVVPTPEPVAAYLARCLIADRGFAPGTFPEAAPLASASDLVLTATDGMTVTIACIVDRDREPERRFALTAAEVDGVARACRVHAGTLYGQRMPVSIEIWEVGAGRPDEDDRQRLSALTFRKVSKGGGEIRTFALDSATGALWSTVAASDHARRAAWAREVAVGPRRTAAQLAPPPPATTFARRGPVVTLGVLAVLVVVFVLEVVLSPATTGALSPPLDVLIGLGALDHGQFEQGDYWRAITAAFLHGDLWHLVLNGVALFMAGSVLEKLVGRAWTLGLFVIGALGGAAGSLIVNPATIATVGASGAIMGMLAAAIVLVFRLPKGQGRGAILASLLQILVPALLPLGTHGGGAEVDYGAHAGGAIAGALAGALLLVTWPRTAGDPRGRVVALVLVAAAGLGLVGGAIDAGGEIPRLAARRALAAQLAADGELEPLQAPTATVEQADALVARFPRDPRVHYLAALADVRADRFEPARAHLEQALAERELLDAIANPQLTTALRELLAAVLVEKLDDEAAAREALAPACAAAPAHDYGAQLRTILCKP